MNSKTKWDDLRLILAVHDAGTLSGAGRRLGISHATVYRRLAGIEDRLGVVLFNGAKSGYAPTPAGEELAATARQIEIHVKDAERRVVGQDLRPSGTVRVATLDSFLVGFLSPIFAEFQIMHGEIALEVAVSNHLYSLSKREADVAIRPSMAPSPALVGRKAGTIAYAAYGRGETGGDPDEFPKLQESQWVGPDETLNYPELESWMTSQNLDRQCRYRVNSVVGMHAGVRQGHGLAVLPCYLGDPDRELVRFSDAIPELATDLWILTHRDLHKAARVRALMEFVFAALKQRRGLLTGTKPG